MIAIYLKGDGVGISKFYAQYGEIIVQTLWYIFSTLTICYIFWNEARKMFGSSEIANKTKH